MAETARDLTIISAEEYLARENDGAWKHEFINGAVYAMGESSDRHNIIAINLATALNVHLPIQCQVFGCDMKLHIQSVHDERFYYPDVFVSCSEGDRARYTREQPIFVAEVLSPATERIDRHEKFDAYTKIPSMQEYALVAQDLPKLELFRRRTEWRRETFSLDDTVTFESVDLTLPMTAIYHRMNF